MKVFYRQEMVADSGAYSPSPAKPEQVCTDWASRGLKIDVVPFSPLSLDDIALAHDSVWAADVLNCVEENGHGNRRWDVADSLRWTTGSHYAAARAAVWGERVTCSPTSGFHHAGYDFAQGFCTFNGLMISAAKLLGQGLDQGLCNRIGIADYDWHYGNGTDDIIDQLELGDSVQQVNASGYRNAEEFLSNIHSDLDSLGEIDLLMYQAGADMHENDPLGGFASNDQLRRRDRAVFQWCEDHVVPVVWNLAGGYQRDQCGSIDKVLAIHRNTLLESASSLERRSVW
jgi:acetoin utilization deacetylase AcuC-like enzyme